MALIDVTELFADPDFVDPISIITRTSTVDTYGKNTVAETTVATLGSVQPASGRALSRLPESLRDPDFKSFWIRGSLPSTVGNNYPCILVHRGIRYAVQNVFDWTNWGSGWSEGLCISEAPTDWLVSTCRARLRRFPGRLR